MTIDTTEKVDLKQKVYKAVVSFFVTLFSFFFIFIMKSIYIQNAPARLSICRVLWMAFLGSAFSFPTSAHPSLMAIHAVDTTTTAMTTEQYIGRMVMVFVLVLTGGFFAGKR